MRGIVYDSYGYVWFATLSGGIGRLLAKSMPQYSDSGPGGVPDLPAGGETVATSGGASEPGSYSVDQSDGDTNEELRKLARTGLNLLPYLIPGLILLLIGLGSGSSSTRR